MQARVQGDWVVLGSLGAGVCWGRNTALEALGSVAAHAVSDLSGPTGWMICVQPINGLDQAHSLVQPDPACVPEWLEWASAHVCYMPHLEHDRVGATSQSRHRM